MSSGRRPEHFAFFDLPRTLWYFLGEERWTFLVFSGVLLTVLCYTMAPPYVVGVIADFLIEYMKAGSGTRVSIVPLFWRVVLLLTGYAIVALLLLPITG